MQTEWTFLKWAASTDRVEVVKVLLAARADKDIKNKVEARLVLHGCHSECVEHAMADA